MLGLTTRILQRTAQLHGRVLHRAAVSPAFQGFSSAPQTSDITAQVTFVNYQGEKVTLTGFHGMSLVDVCTFHGVADLVEDDGGGKGGVSEVVHNERWTEDLFGSGATSKHCHVVVPPQWFDKLEPPSPNEQWILDELEHDVKTPTSRLATEIKLSKELDGLTVYVPDPYPTDIP